MTSADGAHCAHSSTYAAAHHDQTIKLDECISIFAPKALSAVKSDLASYLHDRRSTESESSSLGSSAGSKENFQILYDEALERVGAITEVLLERARKEAEKWKQSQASFLVQCADVYENSLGRGDALSARDAVIRHYQLHAFPQGELEGSVGPPTPSSSPASGRGQDETPGVPNLWPCLFIEHNPSRTFGGRMNCNKLRKLRDLRTHIRRHIKPYYCHKCFFQSAEKVELDRHSCNPGNKFQYREKTTEELQRDEKLTAKRISLEAMRTALFDPCIEAGCSCRDAASSQNPLSTSTPMQNMVEKNVLDRAQKESRDICKDDTEILSVTQHAERGCLASSKSAEDYFEGFQNLLMECDPVLVPEAGLSWSPFSLNLPSVESTCISTSTSTDSISTDSISSMRLLGDSCAEFSGSSKRFTCPLLLCGKTFRYESKLQDHLVSHGTERLPCTICDKKFKRPRDLEKHKRTIHKLDTPSTELRRSPKFKFPELSDTDMDFFAYLARNMYGEPYGPKPG